ncbi:hypothetical protein C8035_v011451 [Colletotrichum spinosum]|uniref:Uncharacterized protein n=1 Tax=Colletotrichum spinosum TaxID=1347390 RepID=A0A4R8QGY3_9PEZI|nr:hypothetical protein C8035_v011451 [Colletotrichum spinosum]
MATFSTTTTAAATTTPPSPRDIQLARPRCFFYHPSCSLLPPFRPMASPMASPMALCRIPNPMNRAWNSNPRPTPPPDPDP